MLPTLSVKSHLGAHEATINMAKSCYNLIRKYAQSYVTCPILIREPEPAITRYPNGLMRSIPTQWSVEQLASTLHDFPMVKSSQAWHCLQVCTSFDRHGRVLDRSKQLVHAF
jgi:hypothetical protein